MYDAEKFDQDLEVAMKEAKVRPAFLTVGGVTTCVLMSYRHYRLLADRQAGATNAQQPDAPASDALAPGLANIPKMPPVS